MEIRFIEVAEAQMSITASMITELMNYHRKLNNSPKEFWQTDEQSIETLKSWLEVGKVYNVFMQDTIVGFFYLRFGGQNVAWLEDLFIAEEFRSQGVGKLALKELDNMLKSKGITSLFVDIIPRNTSAIKFYIECGFDHLNMIQLRKNYNERLNKTDEVEILGFKLYKY